MGAFFRTFTFMGQMLGTVQKNPTLALPIALNIAIAVPVNLVFAILAFALSGESSGLYYAFMGLGIFSLYFIDYFCNGLTASMLYDQFTTGKATLGGSFGRTIKSLPGIVIFAAITALFELAEHVANQQRAVIRRMILGVLRMIWTTATYVVMPAMVIENLGFFAAFKRSKDLAEKDPTQIGVGVVAMGLISWVLSLLTFFAAQAAFGALIGISPLVAIIAALTVTNMFWAVTGYLKITYYTCFYMWATECERQGRAGTDLAPEPLRNAIGGVEAGAW